MQYRPSMTWVDKANARGKQMERALKASEEAPKKKWCRVHPRSFFGETFSQCVDGYRKNEKCEEVKE